MVIPPPLSEAAQRLAHLTRLRDTVSALTQEQVDAVCWLTVGLTSPHPDAWSAASLARTYGPYIARLTETVEHERRVAALSIP